MHKRFFFYFSFFFLAIYLKRWTALTVCYYLYLSDSCISPKIFFFFSLFCRHTLLFLCRCKVMPIAIRIQKNRSDRHKRKTKQTHTSSRGNKEEKKHIIKRGYSGQPTYLLPKKNIFILHRLPRKLKIVLWVQSIKKIIIHQN